MKPTTLRSYDTVLYSNIMTLIRMRQYYYPIISVLESEQMQCWRCRQRPSAECPTILSSLDKPEYFNTRNPTTTYPRILLDSILGFSTIAGYFPLLKGVIHAQGIEGVVWRVICTVIANAVSPLSSLPGKTRLFRVVGKFVDGIGYMPKLFSFCCPTVLCRFIPWNFMCTRVWLPRVIM